MVQQVKNPPVNAGDMQSIPGSRRSPGEGNGNPLPHSCLENPHGQRSLVDYSSQGLKGSDTTERLSTAQHSIIGKLRKKGNNMKLSS